MLNRLRMGALAAVLACGGVGGAAAQTATSITVNAIAAGATPFISLVSLTIQGAAQLTQLHFTIAPKAGSVTRPISATYSAAYLVARGYWDGSSETMTVPVFGLYAGAANTVTLKVNYARAPFVQTVATINTAAYSSTCSYLDSGRVVTQARTATAQLSFDYFMVKEYCDKNSPLILDTDGNVRWVGTDGGTPGVTLIGNSFYIANGSGVDRMEFDGSHASIGDYRSINVTATARDHNFDPGRTGIVMDVQTTTQVEGTNLEIDTSGKVLNEWDFSKIISKAMVAGGDDPSTFVGSGAQDWFHDNSTTYHAADNTLIVSSRENFVIAVDYDTQAIKWIFGDTTKAWYQYPSLRAFALKAANGTVPPIGQHAVSIDTQGDLLLFDDGKPSVYHTPAGVQLKYSAPRAYHIDTTAMTATMTYQDPMKQAIYSSICGSVYEDVAGNYLVDYATANGDARMDLFGLSPTKGVAFEFQYPAHLCVAGWNAKIVHLENLQF